MNFLRIASWDAINGVVDDNELSFIVSMQCIDFRSHTQHKDEQENFCLL